MLTFQVHFKLFQAIAIGAITEVGNKERAMLLDHLLEVEKLDERILRQNVEHELEITKLRQKVVDLLRVRV